jgi:hypothetical protein
MREMRAERVQVFGRLADFDRAVWRARETLERRRMLAVAL